MSSCSTRPVSRWKRWRRWRPSTSWSRSSEPPSGHQSTASTGPTSSSSRSTTSPVRGSQTAGRSSPVRSCVIASRGVARDRGEAARAELPALVPQLADDLAGRRVDDPQRRVEHVAVLAEAERHERLVGGQRARLAGAGERRAGQAHGLRVLVDHARGRVAVGDPDREARRSADAGDGPAPADREPLGPALAARPRGAAPTPRLVERGDDPGAGLGAGRVVEPDDARAVGRRAAVEDADRIERQLAPDAGPAIPGMELVAAALGRAEDHPLRVVGGPGGEGEDRGAEPSLPRGDGRHGLGRCHRRRYPAGASGAHVGDPTMHRSGGTRALQTRVRCVACRARAPR